MSEKLNALMPNLLTVLNVKEAMANFKKKYYEGYFFSYRDSISDVNEEIVKMYDSPDVSSEMESAAEALVSFVSEKRKNTFFFNRTAVLVDMQCLMVFYVLPALLKNPPAFRSKEFTDLISKRWNETFPKSVINAADFEDIYNGFRTTIFGFSMEGLFGSKDGK